MDIFAQLVANSVIAGATYTLITLGFNLIYGATRFTNIAHGVVAALGGYAMFFVSRSWGWGMIASTLAGVLAAGIAGVLLHRLVFAPLLARRARIPVLVIASLGVFTVIQALLSISFTAQFWTLAPSEGVPVYDIGGASISLIQLIIIVTALAVSALLWFFLANTMFGRVVRAISDDEEVAKMLGVNTDRVVSAVFFVGSAIAGLTGILIGFDTGIQPTMGLVIFVEGAIPSIVGGIGNMVGGVLGAFLLGFVENFGIWFIPSQWKGALAFGLLALFLIFRPQGIMGTRK